ncbi:uncharacterized protein LOC126976531 isoform X2 [Leptidea sinapis]|uniref:uncharacterized protein LOC126976531 isoform X2 n=1 Tax=Leptidea sinapis TaxID=189913 RepID=UPI0021C4B65A|nr:uncharacterized protein LOC126976531 isoform X2 [Leptidea sinapis]XP_050680897.1 uncharacterized protein LOC126976531 isoform X2 [Leptidea sinapis]XP_050680903.1 uncharacterized protein LOC126976531 isoform X2 [Leptidea sinapis]
MFPSMWILCITFLMLDVRIEALPQKANPLECYQCSDDQLNCTDPLPTARCSPEQYCTTIATAPNFTSILTCASARKTPCTLERKEEQIVLTCICMWNLCNAPINQHLKHSLLNYSSNFPANSSSDLTETFLNSLFANGELNEFVPKGNKSLIAPIKETHSSGFVDANKLLNVSLPKAEALKHQVTVPPDDDEDENEGSGTAVEDSKAVPSAPAAPSSYLPADKSIATYDVISHILIAILVYIHF